MWPILLEIGPLKLYTYGLMIAIAFLVCIWRISSDAAKAGMNPQAVSDTVVWTVLAGLIGTRLLHIVMYRQFYSWSDPLGWIAIWKGGLVFQGAFVPAFVFCIFYARRRGIPFWQFLDIAVPYFALGQALGRVGCFFKGCCFGAVTDSAAGICFPAGSPAHEEHVATHLIEYSAPWSLPVHPTQLYSIAMLLGLFGVLLVLRKKWRPFDGYLFPLYLSLYGVGRFTVEFFRGDNPHTYFGHLTFQQVFSLGLVAGGVFFFLALANYRSWARSHRSPA